MRGDPVRQLLAPHRLGVGEAGGAQHGDEDLHRDDLAGIGVDHLAGAAGEIDEQLLAGDMDLAHRRLQPPGPGPVEIAEPGIAEPVGARRRGTPPTAAPASRRDGAARDAPRPNRASGADRPGCRRAAETAALRAARRRDPRAAARRGRRRAPGSNSPTPCPGPARGCGPPPAAAARSHSTVAKLPGSGASTVSRPASRPPFDKEDEATFG